MFRNFLRERVICLAHALCAAYNRDQEGTMVNLNLSFSKNTLAMYK